MLGRGSFHFGMAQPWQPLAGAMLNIGGAPLSISFHKKGGTELSWSVSSVQPLSMWPTNVFVPMKWNTTTPPIWHQKRWLSRLGKLHSENFMYRRERSIYIYISISCTSMSIHFLTIFGKFINHHHHHRKKTVVLRIQVSKRSLDRAPPKPQFSTGSEISKSSCSQRPPCEKLGHFFYTNYPKLETNMTVAPEKDGISQKGKDHLPIIHFQGHWLLVSGRVDQMMYSSWWSLLQIVSLFLTEIAHCWPRRERVQDSGKSLRRTWWHSTTHSSPKPLKQFSYPFEICWVQRKGPTKSRWNFLDLFIIFHQSLKICKHYGSPPKSKTLTNLQRFDGWPLWQQKNTSHPVLHTLPKSNFGPLQKDIKLNSSWWKN